MSFFSMFDKLDDIIYRPIEALTNWIEEPLKVRADERKNKELELKADLEIKLKKANFEIEELKKDKELSRSKEIANAIVELQMKLNNVNVQVIQSIGDMNIDLRRKAHELQQEHVKIYYAIQKEESKSVRDSLKSINEEFSDDKQIRNALIKIEYSRMAQIIKNTSAIIEVLNNDIVAISKNIDSLVTSGNKLIEKTIDKLGNSRQVNPKLINNNPKVIEDADFSIEE